MPLFEAVRLALQQIRVQKLKSFFTLLGVTIGVMFLIAVVSIVEGMSNYMEHDLVGKLMGVNSFELRRRPNIQMGDITDETIREWRSRPRIYEHDVPAVVEALPVGTKWSVESQDNAVVSSRYALKPKRVSVSAVDGDWFEIKKMALVAGRQFMPQELERGDPVVIIGQEVKDHFFPGVDPVGRELKVGDLPYTVIGVAEKQGSVFGLSLDKFVIGPKNSRIQRLLNPHAVIDAVIVQAQNGPGMTDAMERVRQVMRARHRLRPSQPDNFSLETSASALEFWNKLKGYLVIAGIALPAIGLVVGAIVIMNIMLVAVAERTREIGIRKSLGARRRDIMAQFLVESATLSTVGAALGVGLGIGFSQFLALVSPLPASVAPWSIIVGVSLGAGVGVAAGAYPASRASRLDPIAALRQE